MQQPDKNDSKRPYVLVVEEKYARYVAVWAENVFEAMEKAEELYSDGKIMLGTDNFAEHSIQRAPVKATDTLLSLIEHYGKDDENV